jgi:hypothetical protein
MTTITVRLDGLPVAKDKAALLRAGGLARVGLSFPLGEARLQKGRARVAG